MKRILGTVMIASALALAGCGGGSETTSDPVEVVIVEQAPTEPAATASAATESAATDAGAAVEVAVAAGGDAEGQAAPGNGAPQGMWPGVSGEVTAVDGSTLTVQDQRQQTTVAVVLTADTQVVTQAAVALADIAVGETVTAMGAQEGELFTATRVQVGATGGFGGGPGGGPGGGMTPPDGQQPPSDMTPPAGDQAPPSGDGSGGPPADMGGAFLSGTVTAASASGLTVTTADGAAVQIVLAEGGAATQQVAGTVADITVGAQITASGEGDEITITATRIEIRTAAGLQ